MAKKAIVLMIIIVVLPAGILWGQDKTRPMTLEECLVRAMERNLGLQVQVLQPELADLGVSRAGEKFLPSLSFEYNSASNRSASFSWIDASDMVITKSHYYSTGITQTLPTGGTFEASLYSSMNETNKRFQTINPYYSSRLAFAFSQPLLKNFGLRVNRKEILVAQNNRDIAESVYVTALLEAMYSVEEAYWNLVFSVENLKVMQKSLKLAKDLLEKNKKEVEIGMMAPIEILSAESEVATREADILQAEVQIKNREDTLRTLLNFKPKGEEENLPITPTDAPAAEKRDVSMDGALAQALASRPELQAARLDLKTKDLELMYSRNQLLPDVSLQAFYWSPALSGTQILYQDDNPLSGVIVGTVPGGSSQAMKDALKFKYRNWSVSLSLTMPLNFVFSRALAAQAKVNLKQARLVLEDKEQQLCLEVRNAVREVENNAKRVEAYEAARKLAEKKLEAEERKVKVGLSTNYTLLQMQRDFANAQSQELKARIDYVLSLAKLDKATGTSLERHNIKWTGF